MDEMGEWCRTHCPTNNYDYAAVLPGQGPLHEVSGPDRSGAEGYSRYFVCRRCGSRWRIFDWVCTGWVDYEQESVDGKYSSRGKYVGGKKDGWHGYSRYEPVRTIREGRTVLVSPLILSELWDHGRLVERQELGPVEVDAQGNAHHAVVRTWHARKKVESSKAKQVAPTKGKRPRKRWRG
jgi:hypothetical protein